MNRWVANKLGLINFWYYDEEEFELASGKLLFRGSNGSGKSVTMQSFIPLLLDGNKSPERLDPFGSKARRIENYLLDEETDEKTAYLYIEFKRQEQEHYLTIGMGLKAVKNKPLDSWYFIITDGRRIGKDLMLYKDAGEKIPLTKKQLENEMKEGGLFITTQGEYMRSVNEHLFGFDSTEQYEELLNLLINLRSPKLSKDFKPTEIYKILSNSLKVLSEDDLRPMSEAMENMDSYQGNLESYQRTQNACKNIKYHYDHYNQFKLSEKAQKVVSHHEEVSQKVKKRKAEENNLLQMESQYKDKKQEKEEKDELFQRADILYNQLSSRKEVGIKKELLELEEDINENKTFIKQKQVQLEVKKEQRLDQEKQKRQQTGQYEEEETQLKEKLEELEEVAEQCYFEEGSLLKEEVLENPLAYQFEYIDITLDKYLKRIEGLQKEVIHYEDMVQKKDAALEEKETKEKEALQKRHEAEEANGLLLQSKEDYKVQFVNWQKEATHMRIPEDKRIELFKQTDALEAETKLYVINDYLRPFYENQYSLYRVDLERTHAEIKTHKAHILEIKTEIEALKNAKEIEPDRLPEVIRNRERLKEAGIPFSPLYKVIDFKKETSEETKCTIESALVSMGLIDALVVNPKDLNRALSFREKDADRYILTEGNVMRYNLSQYLEVDQANLLGISFETVDKILTGIYLDEDKLAYVNEKGEYGLGILRGKASQDYETKYIGASARKRHRQLLIEEKEREIGEIEKVISQLEEQQESIHLQLKALEAEYKKLPTIEDLRAALVLREQKERKANELYEEYIKLDEKYFKCQKLCQQLKSELFEKLQGIQIPANKESFYEALHAGRTYQFGIVQLKSIQSNLKNCNRMLEGIDDQIARLDEDMDSLLYDIGQKEQTLKRQMTRKESLEEVLKTTHIEEIEEQLGWCLKVKQEVPTELAQINTTLGKLEDSIERTKESLVQIEQSIQVEKQKLEEATCLFNEEYALGYVMQEMDLEPVKCCKKILENSLVDMTKGEQAYTVALMTAISSNAADLREYGVKTNQMKDRISLSARLEGKEIDFYQFGEMIHKYIEDTKLLISEEERRIFEEVLLNTISSKITSKIYLSKQWIDKINRLMESMKTSSSLKLSLKWVPRKAENEGQLDISELLKLLELGDRCTDEDMKKITDHFGAKVKEGIRNYEGTSEARNYHTIIQEVLDYRKWYEFKLSFEKKNERKKELTNNEFFRFSGGEKAMSMYIPLFSAVYARYENASKDCPRIISMDEAFAGVDEDNIRDMFRLLDELDLDFIINSQVLWGDYDTVKDLAISEIIREENDTTVLVLRYHWNGVQKVLVE